MQNVLARKVGAELIGTFGLVTAGCGAIIASSNGNLPPIGVALAFGLVITIMVAATGHISGGHINPAVSIGLAVTRRLPWKELPWYLLAQFVGAIAAAGLLRWIFGAHALLQTVNAPAAHISPLQATGIEVILTAFLVFVISAVATDSRGIGKLAPFAIGATILVDALWGGPISGASMNPARSFGPARIALDWTSLWVYFVGPIVGGIIGALLYQLIRQPEAPAQAERSLEKLAPAPIIVKDTPRMTVNTPRVSSNNKKKNGARR